ncbi:MAG TPA: hypothetical protein VFT45_23950 [Longimicrobium sp.]|nr:hypothetical protein [Longimicrobium sp.]
MSFNDQARRVRDAGNTPWRRLSSLRACLRSYCRLSGASYENLSAYLEIDYWAQPRRLPPTPAFLRRTLDEIERERNRYLERRRLFERRRVLAKWRGNRQMSNAERKTLKELL